MLLRLALIATFGCTGTLKGGGVDGGAADSSDDAPGVDAALDATDSDSSVDSAVDAGVDGGDPDGGAADAPTDTFDAGPIGCPASGIAHHDGWVGAEAYTFPSSGSSRIDLFLSNQTLLHYERAVVEWDMRTNTTHGVFTQIFEIRSVNPGASWTTTPTRYAALTTRNSVNEDTGEPTIWRDVFVQTTWGMCDEYTQSVRPYKMKNNHDYHVRFEWDATTNMSSTVLTEEDGTEIVTMTDAASSLVPLGRGIHLLFGVSDMHGDWEGGMRPPWGWTFSNLVADLFPGGPHGTAAPLCDGTQAPGC